MEYWITGSAMEKYFYEWVPFSLSEFQSTKQAWDFVFTFFFQALCISYLMLKIHFVHVHIVLRHT